MNDNYLWDRTGQPDPEIQKLEELLGTLRYQPRPLEIPSNVSIGSRRSVYVPMTIAAAIILATILFGLWFEFHRTPAAPPLEVKHENSVPSPENAKHVDPEPKPTVVRNETPEVKPQRQLNRNLLAVNRRQTRRPEAVEPVLSRQEEAEKEQVLLALRFVSAKLNLVQRKTTSTPSSNLIHNHKIG